MAHPSEEIEFDTDELEEQEDGQEQEDEQEQEVQDRAPAGTARAEAAPANRWERMRNAIARFGNGDKVRLPGESESEEEDEKGEDGEDAKDRARDDANERKPQDASAAKPPAGNQPDGPPTKPASYTIVDADGDEAELEWPDGAKIRFKADGKPVEVKSLDELVTYAQKGVAFDRRSSEWGRERSELSRTLSDLEQQVKDAEEVILKAVFGDKEVRAHLRKQLRPFRDPAVRDLAAKAQELEERKASDKQQAERQREEIAGQFWEAVDRELAEAMKDREYVDAEDAPAIKERFYQNYLEFRDALVEKFKGEAKALNVSEEVAVAKANEVAATYLTEENLRTVVQAFEDHYASRAGRKAGARPRNGARARPQANAGDANEDLDEAADRTAAERHNQRVRSKLEQRNRPRVLRGGGAPPGGSGAELPGEGLTYAQRMEAMRRELRKAARPS